MASTTFNKAAAATDLKAFFDRGPNTLKVVLKLTQAGVLDVNTAFLFISIFTSAKMIEKKIEAVELERLFAEGKKANNNAPISELEVLFTNLLPDGVESDSLTITAFESNNAGLNAQIGPGTGLILSILASPSKPTALLLSKTVTAGTPPYLDTAATVRIILPQSNGGKPFRAYNTFVYGRSGSDGSILLKNTVNTSITTADIITGFIDVPTAQTQITGASATPLIDSDKIFIYVSVDNTSGLESPLSDPIEYICSLKFSQPKILSAKNAQIFEIGAPRVPLRLSAAVSEGWDRITIWHRPSTAIGVVNTASYVLAQEYQKTSVAADLLANGYVDLEWQYSDNASTTLKALQVYDIIAVVSSGTSTITSPAATQSNFTPPLKVAAGIIRTNHQIFTQSGLITTGALVEQRFVNTYTNANFPAIHKLGGNDLYMKVKMIRISNGKVIDGPIDTYQQLVAGTVAAVPSTATFNLKAGVTPAQFLETDRFTFSSSQYLSLNVIQQEFLNLDPDLKQRIETIQGANLFKYNEFSSIEEILPQPTSTVGLPEVKIKAVEELLISGVRRLGVSLQTTQLNTDIPYPWFKLELQYSTNIGFASGNQTVVLTSAADLLKEYHIINADTTTAATDFAVSTPYYFRLRIYHAWSGASNATLSDSALLNRQNGQTGVPTSSLTGDYKTFNYTTGAAAAITSPTVAMARTRPTRLQITATQVAATTNYQSQTDWKTIYFRYQVINQLGEVIPGLERQVLYNDKVASGALLAPEIFDIPISALDQFVGAIVKIGYFRNGVTVESGSTRPAEIFFEKSPVIKSLSYVETSTTIQLIADVDVGLNDNNNNVVTGGAALTGGIGQARALVVIGLIPAIESGNALTGTEKYSHNMTYDAPSNTYRTVSLTKIINSDLYGSNLRFTVFANNNTGYDVESFVKT